jgi:hypothetical protein
MSNLIGNLAKAALGVGVVYLAYKMGESNAKKEPNVLDDIKNEINSEIDSINNLIRGYELLPNQTQKDLENRQFLESRVEELKRKL